MKYLAQCLVLSGCLVYFGGLEVGVINPTYLVLLLRSL